MINKYIRDILLVSVFAMFCNNSFAGGSATQMQVNTGSSTGSAYISTGGDNKTCGGKTVSGSGYCCPGGYWVSGIGANASGCPTGALDEEATIVRDFGSTDFNPRDYNINTHVNPDVNPDVIPNVCEILGNCNKPVFSTEEYNCTLKEDPTSHDIGCCVEFSCSAEGGITEDSCWSQLITSTSNKQSKYCKILGPDCYKLTERDDVFKGTATCPIN